MLYFPSADRIAFCSAYPSSCIARQHSLPQLSEDMTHLIERPREAASHAAALREGGLVAERVRVIVRDDRLARRVVEEL
jgi:hypothetical protein